MVPMPKNLSGAAGNIGGNQGGNKKPPLEGAIMKMLEASAYGWLRYFFLCFSGVGSFWFCGALAVEPAVINLTMKVETQGSLEPYQTFNLNGYRFLGALQMRRGGFSTTLS